MNAPKLPPKPAHRPPDNWPSLSSAPEPRHRRLQILLAIAGGGAAAVLWAVLCFT